jgi:hypothetical protein
LVEAFSDCLDTAFAYNFLTIKVLTSFSGDVARIEPAKRGTLGNIHETSSDSRRFDGHCFGLGLGAR